MHPCDVKPCRAGRLLGITIFPSAAFFDGASNATTHELGHQWLAFLDFPPLQQGVPHWPISDLAQDIMGFSISGGEGGISISICSRWAAATTRWCRVPR